MTAVVTFNHQNQPYIISDVLLTGPEDANKKQSVPTIRDVTEIFPRGTGWTVVGLCQKTVIIDGYLAIGFSGQVIVAITLLKEIKEQSTIKRFNSTSIKIFINEFVKAHPSHNEIDLVGCIIDLKFPNF